MPVEELEAKNFFSFMYFHGPSAAQPHGWPVLMKNGKVRILLQALDKLASTVAALMIRFAVVNVSIFLLLG